MAYTPRTWNNEVITDAKLNALENGLAAASTLTGTDIDADKDWNGKNITNVGTLQATTISGNLAANKFSVVASDTAIPTLSASKANLYGSDSTITHLLTCTMPAGLKAGSTFRCTVSTDRSAGGIRVLVNGTEVYSSTSTKTYDCSVNPGDTLTIQYVGGLLSYGGTTLSAVVRGTLTPIIDLATQDWAVVL